MVTYFLVIIATLVDKHVLYYARAYFRLKRSFRTRSTNHAAAVNRVTLLPSPDLAQGSACTFIVYAIILYIFLYVVVTILSLSHKLAAGPLRHCTKNENRTKENLERANSSLFIENGYDRQTFVHLALRVSLS